MEQSKKLRCMVRQPSVGFAAMAILASGGFAASVFAVGAAGSVTRHTTNKSITTSKVVISTAKNAKLGTILVDGKTLYILAPSKTACTSACLKIWPAITLPKGVKKAVAGNGVNAAKLGTVKRLNGAIQVTYFGKALYWFVGDQAAGQVHGNITDKWGKWSTYVTFKPKTVSTATTSGSTVTTTAGSGGIAF